MDLALQLPPASSDDMWLSGKRYIRKQSKVHLWGRSSIGRAPALQAGGRGFDTLRLHQVTGTQCKGSNPYAVAGSHWVVPNARRTDIGDTAFGKITACTVDMPHQHNWLMHLTLNQGIQGSSPWWGTKCTHSSAGRASALQAEGRRFEPVILHHYADLAQLVEQLTCNQQVVGSIPIVGTTFTNQR